MALVLIFVRNSPKLHRTHESLIDHDIGLADIYNTYSYHSKTFTLSKKTSKDTKLIIFLTKLRIDVINAPVKPKTFIFLQCIISNFFSKY